MERDSATFQAKGHKFLHCPGTKGQQDKRKILQRDWTDWDSQNSGWAGTTKTQDGTEQKRMLDVLNRPSSKTGK